MLDIILAEIWAALLWAMGAVYFTSFFGPIQELRKRLVATLMNHSPEFMHPVYAPFYCAKCFAFWGSGIWVYVMTGSPLFTIRVALLSGLIAYALDLWLYSKEEE